jgi:hypothetical protein
MSQRDYQALLDTLNRLKDDNEAQQQLIDSFVARPVNVNADALMDVVSRASRYVPLVVIVFLVGCVAGLLLAKMATVIVAGVVAGVVLAIGLAVGHRP